MKKRTAWWVAVISFLSFVRLLITLRGGAVSGDDMLLLTDCFNWWHKGNADGLRTIYGSSGIIYAGFHHFLWAALAGMMSFRLGPLFTIHALLIILPCLVLAWQFRGRPETPWAVAIALTAPLTTYLSLSLLPLWWLAPLSGMLVLNAPAAEDRGTKTGLPGLIFIGAICGYFSSVYPSLSPLTLGFFIWLLVRREPAKRYAGFLIGCFLGFVPYLVLLTRYWGQLSPRLQVVDGSYSWVQMVGSIFRFWSLPILGRRSNSAEPWLGLEEKLSSFAPWLWVFCVVFCLYAVVKEWRAKRRFPAYIQLALCVWPSYLLFTAATHTEGAYHQAGNLWWMTALLLPWSCFTLFPRRGSWPAAAFLAVNLIGLAIMFGDRTWVGTTAIPGDSRGHGPSWWMQESIADQLSRRAQAELDTGNAKPLAVKCEPFYWLNVSLPALFAIQHPELGSKVKWVATGFEGGDLVVTKDRDKSNHLRLAVWPDIWHREKQKRRMAIKITSSLAANHAVQLPIVFPRAKIDSAEFVAEDGKPIPACWEFTPDSATVWVKLGALAATTQNLWVYYDGVRENNPSTGKEVFDYFDDFKGDLSQFEIIGSGKWEIKDGVCRLTLPATPADTMSTQLLLKRPPQSSGTVEARIRFPKFKNPIDPGVVFASEPGTHGYLWNFTGYGATMLTELKENGVPRLVDWSEWVWHAKANKWFLIGAEWNGPAIKSWAEGRNGPELIYDTINPGSQNIGRVGIGAKAGQGAPPSESTVEFAWVRVRTTPPANSFNISYEHPESRR